jgi:hypothetical protein
MPTLGKGEACPNFKTNECRRFLGYSFGTAENCLISGQFFEYPFEKKPV